VTFCVWAVPRKIALASEASTHYHDLSRTNPDVFGTAAENVDGLVTALGENEP
jgi:hypothetical protein